MTEFRAIPVEAREWRPRARPSLLAPDRVFVGVLTVLAGTILLLAGLIVVELWLGAADARHAFGFGFVTSTAWDPVHHVFGALPYVYGTIVTSLLAVLLAAPVGVATAIFLVELAPRRLRAPLGFLVELLAAIPSVVYGLWALFVLVPIVRQNIEPWLGSGL